MASATTIKKIVKKFIEVEEPRIVLELSENEARTLYTIFQHIGGDPSKTARKYSDEVLHALNSSNLNLNNLWSTKELLIGSITFGDSSLDLVENKKPR